MTLAASGTAPADDGGFAAFLTHTVQQLLSYWAAPHNRYRVTGWQGTTATELLGGRAQQLQSYWAAGHKSYKATGRQGRCWEEGRPSIQKLGGFRSVHQGPQLSGKEEALTRRPPTGSFHPAPADHISSKLPRVPQAISLTNCHACRRPYL